MSWTDTFYWLAILALSLALAQLGVSHISPSLYTGIFKHEPSNRVREVMRVASRFLAIISILALGLALLAVVNLIFGFGTNLAILITHQWHFANNTILSTIIQVLICLALALIVFLIFKSIWRVAARMPDTQQDTSQDRQQLHEDLKQLIEAIKQNQIQVPSKVKRRRKKE